MNHGISHMLNLDITPHYWKTVDHTPFNQSLIQGDKVIFQRDILGKRVDFQVLKTEVLKMDNLGIYQLKFLNM